MRITGRISAVGQLGQPTGQYGTMYQDITVTDSAGQNYFGNIGTKQQGGYAVGTDITVDSSEGQYGTKFKRVTDFQQNQGQQGGQQGYHQQPQQNRQQPQQQPQQMPPRQDNTQARIAKAQSINIANLQFCHGKIDKSQMKETAEMFEKILNTNQWPFDMSMTSPQQEQQQPPQQQSPPPTDTTNYGTDLNDPIPF